MLMTIYYLNNKKKCLINIIDYCTDFSIIFHKSMCFLNVSTVDD